MTSLHQVLTEVCIYMEDNYIHHFLYYPCTALVTCREMLGLPSNELVEVVPERYPRYEV